MSTPEHRDQPMPLTAHLAELRKRLMIITAAVAVGFGVSYGYAEELFNVLLMPLREVLPDDKSSLVFTGLTEPFIVYLKTALLAGVFLAMPIIFLQIWLFVRPAFRGGEERYATTFVLFGSALFVSGALFGYFIVFPFGFEFLLQFGLAEFLPMLAIREYFGLATKMLFAFGIMFETPLVLLLLGRIGAVDAAWLRKNRKFAIVGILVVSAMLTPPDVITQVMLGLPLLLLYEVGTVLVVLFGRRPPGAEPPDPEAEDAS